MANHKTNIIITGAGNGIGLELVKKYLAAEDKNIFAISRNIDNLLMLSDNDSVKHSSKVFPIQFDLENSQYENELLPQILHISDKIDILINNAGILINKPFYQQTDDDFDKQFNVNIKAAFKMSKLLYPYLSGTSHIVNISSMGGFQGSSKFVGLSLYSASKGALTVFTECLAEELKEKGIKVNCLSLGSTQTKMLEKAFPGYKAQVSAEKMAEFIAEFALNAHQWINGKVIPVSLSNP